MKKVKAFVKESVRAGNIMLEESMDVTVMDVESVGPRTKVKVETSNGLGMVVTMPKENLLLDLGDTSWVFDMNSPM